MHDEIEMFAMHLLPPTTQKTCHHLYEVNRNAIREISNCHLILLCVKRWNGTDDVDLSTSWWKNFNRWQNNIRQIGCYCKFLAKLQDLQVGYEALNFHLQKGSKEHIYTLPIEQILLFPKLSLQFDSSWSLLAMTMLMGQVAYWHNTSF